MTPDQAYAALCQVDLVPKKRGHGFQFRDATVDAQGQGVALVKTYCSPESIIRWFRTATAPISRMEMQPSGWWRVWFVMQELEQ
jgi:hypothetical protein